MGFIAQKLPAIRWRNRRQGQRRPTVRRARVPWLALVAAAFLTVFLGMVTALGALQLTVGLAGMLVALPVFFLVSTRLMLPTLFVIVFLVQGTAEYFLNLRMATWLATMFCGLFFARALLELSNRPRTSLRHDRSVPGAGWVIGAATTYLLFYFFSLGVGHGSVMQTVSAIRFCLPMFGVLFALYWFEWDEAVITRIWWMMVGIMFVQLPFVAYQHLFLMSTFGWDGVNGTFGKNMSAILVLFSLGTSMYVLSRWSRGLTSMAVVIPVCIASVVIILFGEVKAVLFWMPVGVFWVLRVRLMRNVVALATFIFLSFAFVGGTYTAYKALYWNGGAGYGKDDTIIEKLDSIGGYVIDPNNINYKTGEISRAASLMLWYRDTVPSGVQRLIGHGPGATAISSSTGLGVVAKRYRPLSIAATTVATLLWDVGIAGLVAYVVFLVSGIVAGYRFVRRGKASPAMLAAVDTSTGVVALLLTTIIYNRALIDEPTVQLLCFFCLGVIVQACRYHGRVGVAVPRPNMPAPAVHVVPAR